MFGGVGLYSGELFFGLIDDDTLFFKTDESNIAPYTSARCRASCRSPIGRKRCSAYHQVPADIIEDAEALVDWARKSVAVALRSQVAKSKPKRAAAAKQARPKTAQKTARPKAAKQARSGPRRRRPANRAPREVNQLTRAAACRARSANDSIGAEQVVPRHT